MSNNEPRISDGEKFWIGASLRTKALVTPTKKLIRSIAVESRNVLEIIDEVDLDVAGTPRRVPRQFGIPDEWRTWSLLMLVEHLTSFDAEILEIINSLCEGVSPFLAFRLSNLTPNEDVGEEVVDEFQTMARHLQKTLLHNLPLRSLDTHNHPQFGPLNVHQWLSYYAIYHRIYRRYARKITTEFGIT
ncbi:MAG TPA: hypothetical protein PKD64_15945 [Pirellulaceae bacterium]|nr:hypothetical protein [Pirellulaceae bacterium]